MLYLVVLVISIFVLLGMAKNAESQEARDLLEGLAVARIIGIFIAIIVFLFSVMGNR